MKYAIIFLLTLSVLIYGCSRGSNIIVDFQKMDSDLSSIASVTYDCNWVGGGNTIKCTGIISNNAQDKIIELNPRMVVLDSNECLMNCSDEANIGNINPGQKIDYTLSCIVPQKQNVKIILLPQGGFWISKC